MTMLALRPTSPCPIRRDARLIEERFISRGESPNCGLTGLRCRCHRYLTRPRGLDGRGRGCAAPVELATIRAAALPLAPTRLAPKEKAAGLRPPDPSALRFASVRRHPRRRLVHRLAEARRRER